MDIFTQAVACSGSERAALLDTLCARHPKLRADVERMLALDEGAGTDRFLTGAGAQLSPGISVGVEGLGHAPGALGDLPTLAGHYRIIRQLGEGGMGVVYLAEQTMPQRLVALKAVHSGVGRSILQRFMREAHILGRLHHPGIAQIYEAGIAGEGRGGADGDVRLTDGRAYIVIEYVDGPTLTDHATRAGLSRAERLHLFVRVCEAVHHAHLRRVVHRDLKPQNILVDPSGQPKVLDFGIARLDADDERLDVTRDDRALLGTPAYMSPEQLSGAEVDARADVYALGVVLFQLLTGALPHDLAGKSVAQVMRTVREQPPRRLSTLDPSLRGELDAILAVAMHREPESRYQSADALASDIRRHLAGEAISARTEPLSRTIVRVARKHTAVVTLAALLVLALGAAAGIASVMASRNKRLANDAMQAKSAAETMAERNRTLADDANQARSKAEVSAAELREALYVSRVGHAQAALSAGDVLRAGAELAACPEEQRGWEWRHLSAGTDLSEARHELPFSNATVEPLPGGAEWLIARSRRAFRIVHAETGAARLQFGNPGEFGSTHLSPDGSRLLVRRFDGLVDVYDMSSRSLMRSIEPPAMQEKMQKGTGLVLADWLPDNDSILCLRFDGRAFVYSLRAGSFTPGYAISNAPPYAIDVSRAPDEIGLAAVCLGDQSVRVFSMADGRPVAKVEKLEQTPVAIAVSPVAPIAAIGLFDGRVLLWNWREQQASTPLRTLGSHASRVISLAFSPDGATLATGGDDRLLRTWDVAAGTPIAAQPGTASRIRTVFFTPDSASVWVVGEGKTARRFAARPRPLVPTASLKDFPVFWCAIPPGSPTAIVTTRRGEIARVHLQSGVVSYIAGTTSGMRGALPTPAGDMVLVLDGGRVVYTEPSGRSIKGLQELPDGFGTLLAASRDGMHLVAWQRQGTIAPIDWKNRAMGPSWRPVQSIGCVAVGSTPGGDGLVAVADAGGPIRVCDPAGTTLGPELRPKNHAWSMAFSSDGRFLAAAFEPSTIIIWEWRTGKVLHEFKGAWASIGSLEFFDQDRRLAGGGADHIVHVWRLPGGEEVLSLAGHRGAIQNLAVSEDGQTLVSADGMGVVKVWHAPERASAPAPASEPSAE